MDRWKELSSCVAAASRCREVAGHSHVQSWFDARRDSAANKNADWWLSLLGGLKIVGTPNSKLGKRCGPVAKADLVLRMPSLWAGHVSAAATTISRVVRDIGCRRNEWALREEVLGDRRLEAAAVHGVAVGLGAHCRPRSRPAGGTSLPRRRRSCRPSSTRGPCCLPSMPSTKTQPCLSVAMRTASLSRRPASRMRRPSSAEMSSSMLESKITANPARRPVRPIEHGGRVLGDKDLAGLQPVLDLLRQPSVLLGELVDLCVDLCEGRARPSPRKSFTRAFKPGPKPTSLPPIDSSSASIRAGGQSLETFRRLSDVLEVAYPAGTGRSRSHRCSTQTAAGT